MRTGTPSSASTARGARTGSGSPSARRKLATVPTTISSAAMPSSARTASRSARRCAHRVESHAVDDDLGRGPVAGRQIEARTSLDTAIVGVVERVASRRSGPASGARSSTTCCASCRRGPGARTRGSVRDDEPRDPAGVRRVRVERRRPARRAGAAGGAPPSARRARRGRRGSAPGPRAPRARARARPSTAGGTRSGSRTGRGRAPRRPRRAAARRRRGRAPSPATARARVRPSRHHAGR